MRWSDSYSFIEEAAMTIYIMNIVVFEVMYEF